MFCKWCNTEVEVGALYCANCGRKLNDDASNLEQNVFNQSEGMNNISQSNVEKVNVGLVILSFIIPLIGLILFLVKKKEKPRTAKACGICALVSFILNIIVVVLFFVLVFSASGRLIYDLFELSDPVYDNDYYEDYYDDIEDEIEGVFDDNDGNIVSGSITNDWKKYQIGINSNTITLPTSYDKLSNLTGFTFKSANLKSYIEGGHYAFVNMYKNDKLALYTEVLNDTDSDLLYTDCKITRISQTKYQVSQGALVLVFPGGLKVGQSITEDKIIELFGTPDDIYEYSSEGYVSKEYKYLEDDLYVTTNNYIITVVNGVIDELQLDNR